MKTFKEKYEMEFIKLKAIDTEDDGINPLKVNMMNTSGHSSVYSHNLGRQISQASDHYTLDSATFMKQFKENQEKQQSITGNETNPSTLVPNS